MAHLEDSDAVQTAMLLTEQEWDDLAEMVAHYRLSTEWVEVRAAAETEGPAHVTKVRRLRSLALRIIDACCPSDHGESCCGQPAACRAALTPISDSLPERNSL